MSSPVGPAPVPAGPCRAGRAPVPARTSVVTSFVPAAPGAVALLVLGLVLAGCLPRSATPAATPDVVDVRVAAALEVESRLLAEVAAGLVARAGGTAEVVQLADAGAARRALELGDVDVLPAYTGEAWLEVLNRADPPADRATSLARVREADERSGLVWLSPPIGAARDPGTPPADATFAFVVAPEGPTTEVATLSQLATLLGQLEVPTLCVDAGFAERADGLAAVYDAYSIQGEPIEVLDVEPADAVAGVVAGACLAGLTTATDGLAWRAGLRPLVDDLGVFPAFVVTLVVDDDLLTRRSELVAGLRPLVAGMTTARLGGWNARVAAGEAVQVVAAEVVTELVGEAPEPPG